MKRYVNAKSRCNDSSRLTTCARIDTSSAETGSSRTTIFGFSASARAKPMRCRWPPENSCGKRLPCSGLRPTVRSSSSTRARLSRPLYRPCTRRGSATISRTVIRGLSDAYGSWNTICNSRRMSRICRLRSRVMSRPPNMIVPDVGSISFITVRPSVVLPQPDSPTRPSVSPSVSERSTPSTACT